MIYRNVPIIIFHPDSETPSVWEGAIGAVQSSSEVKESHQLKPLERVFFPRINSACKNDLEVQLRISLIMLSGFEVLSALLSRRHESYL